MSEMIQTIILAIVIGACALGVAIGIVKTIGVEYRKTSDHAGDVITQALKEIPGVAKDTIKVMEDYQNEQKEKALRKEWEEHKSKLSMKSVKDEDGWGIM